MAFFRAGAAFWVVLDRDDGGVFIAHAFNGVVKKVAVCDNSDVFNGFRDAVVVVLRGDFNGVCFQVFNGVVAPMMAKFEFVGGVALRDREQLMPQANAKHRDFSANELFDFSNFLLQTQRIAWPVRKENPMDFFFS